MEAKTSRLVIEGNAFYEIDMDCIRKREERKKEESEMSNRMPEKDKENRKTPFLHAVMNRS